MCNDKTKSLVELVSDLKLLAKEFECYFIPQMQFYENVKLSDEKKKILEHKIKELRKEMYRLFGVDLITLHENRIIVKKDEPVSIETEDEIAEKLQKLAKDFHCIFINDSEMKFIINRYLAPEDKKYLREKLNYCKAVLKHNGTPLITTLKNLPNGFIPEFANIKDLKPKDIKILFDYRQINQENPLTISVGKKEVKGGFELLDLYDKRNGEPNKNFHYLMNLIKQDFSEFEKTDSGSEANLTSRTREFNDLFRRKFPIGKQRVINKKAHKIPEERFTLESNYF